MDWHLSGYPGNPAILTFPNDIQQCPRQIFARTEVRENTLDGGGESQSWRSGDAARQQQPGSRPIARTRLPAVDPGHGLPGIPPAWGEQHNKSAS